MNIKSDLDEGFFVATLLNVFFLLGLIFIMKTENLFILIPYAIIMCINASYLVAKAMKIKNKESDNKKKLK
ncbi:hypothetical protein [Staphylococcus equorum]|uniref:hypothetical protein n=1 Tax=Staphylococcus equorum TaxID=246432 RepID=UPI003CF23ED9